MSDLPKITIITPTYNSEASIESCLLSVANQNYSNKEHLIIDGQSNDNTLNIIQNYVKNYPHIKWRSEKDEGIYDAMNKGIDWSTGEWLYFLGSDDIFYNDTVLENIFINDLSNLDVVYGNVQWGDTKQIYDGPFSGLKLMGKNICHQAIFFKRSVFSNLGKYQVEYNVLADWVFNMKWFNAGNIRWKYIEDVIAKYGVAGHSSQNIDKKFSENEMELIRNYFSEEYFEIYQTIRKYKEIIDIKNQDLLYKERMIQRKEQELNLMKSSKFWKLRNLYKKIEIIVLGNK